jgi:hypothetical protein
MKIRIDKTSGGFGLVGGMLYQSESRKLHAECLDCFCSHQPISGMIQQKPSVHQVASKIA